jgi:hypothetical protein
MTTKKSKTKLTVVQAAAPIPDLMTPEAKNLIRLAEAVAFISATVGETFGSHDATSMHWDAGSNVEKGEDGKSEWSGPPVGLETTPDLKITVSFYAAVHAGAAFSQKLYAIVGWATYHGYEVEWD